MPYLLKSIPNSVQNLALFLQKQILKSRLGTKTYKNRTMKISLFNYSMLWYISPIATFLLHIYKRNSCPTHIFKPIPRMDFNHHTTQEYFRQTYNYLGPLQTSTTMSNLLCNILQETRFSSCQRN